MSDQTSELPWEWEKDGNSIYVTCPHGTIAKVGPCGPTDEEDEANAEFIVRAVNCHGELVAAIESCKRIFHLGGVTMPEVDILLAKAKGGQ